MTRIYTKEEKRVVTGSEQKTAQAMGEAAQEVPTRTNHEGGHYPTAALLHQSHQFSSN